MHQTWKMMLGVQALLVQLMGTFFVSSSKVFMTPHASFIVLTLNPPPMLALSVQDAGGVMWDWQSLIDSGMTPKPAGSTTTLVFKSTQSDVVVAWGGVLQQVSTGWVRCCCR